MDKEKWIIAGAAGAVAGTAAYLLWTKRDLPKRATVVQPFELERFLGKWHEIARLPNKIEKNMKALTERYAMRKDGFISIVTRGFDTHKQRWVRAIGKAKLAAHQHLGKLKVSYFGPFYFDYNVLDVDESYRYALVSGGNLDSLWILSRETTIPEVIKERFIHHAHGIGFDTDKLEWPATA
jgi:apolipoprotein D and lipocalin family protein